MVALPSFLCLTLLKTQWWNIHTQLTSGRCAGIGEEFPCQGIARDNAAADKRRGSGNQQDILS